MCPIRILGRAGRRRWRELMGVFRLMPLGVGDAFSARHYSSSLVLAAEGGPLLVDCPHPIRTPLREASGTAGPAAGMPHLAAVTMEPLHSDPPLAVAGP